MTILLSFEGESTMESNDTGYAELPKEKIGVYEFPSFWKSLSMLFQKSVKAEHLVLDAGCGKGEFLKSPREGTYHVGLDIERKNIRKAMQRRGACAFVLGDVQSLPFRKETHDFVFCRDVLEHVKSCEKTIKAFSFVLKEKGVALISTTNILNPWLFLDTLLPHRVSGKIIKKLGGGEYSERDFRFSPWKIIKTLRENKLEPELMMFGIPFPRFDKHSIIYYLWITLDKLTNFNPFRRFKEVIVVIARK